MSSPFNGYLRVRCAYCQDEFASKFARSHVVCCAITSRAAQRMLDKELERLGFNPGPQEWRGGAT